MALTLVAEAGQLVSAPDPAAEANHRIANSISIIAALIRRQSAQLGHDGPKLDVNQVRLILEEIGGRLDAVAHLHRLLVTAHGDAIDLAEYLHDVANSLMSSLSLCGHAELSFDGEPKCRMAAEKAVPLGLLVGELVTNSLKYAHPTGVPGKIGIACRRGANGSLLVEVADDGVGLPENLDPMTGGNLGLRIVRGLADQLGARLSFDSSPLGLRCLLELPSGANT